ncbi:MAG: peroxiredoxin family protein [bacterium JZ-2024 1]
MIHNKSSNLELVVALLLVFLFASFLLFPTHTIFRRDSENLPRLSSRTLERFLNDEDFAGGKVVKVGDTAPDFKIEYLDGQETRLSYLIESHSVVVLNFFATWCGPCREELPELSALGNEFGGEGLVVVAVSPERVQKIRDFARDRLPGVLLGRDEGGNGQFSFGVSGIPATFIITSDRKVQAHFAGYSPNRIENMRKQIREYLRSHQVRPFHPESPDEPTTTTISA